MADEIIDVTHIFSVTNFATASFLAVLLVQVLKTTLHCRRHWYSTATPVVVISFLIVFLVFCTKDGILLLPATATAHLEVILLVWELSGYSASSLQEEKKSRPPSATAA